MKKSCIFLLVMSIISLLTAVWGAIGAYQVWDTYSAHKELNRLYNNDIDTAFTDMSLYPMLIFYAAVVAAGLILGVFGIIGSVKRGRFTIVCMILGGIPALYAFFGNVVSIVKEKALIDIYVFTFIYAVLYTAAAAVAFAFRKAV